MADALSEVTDERWVLVEVNREDKEEFLELIRKLRAQDKREPLWLAGEEDDPMDDAYMSWFMFTGLDRGMVERQIERFKKQYIWDTCSRSSARYRACIYLNADVEDRSMKLWSASSGLWRRLRQHRIRQLVALSRSVEQAYDLFAGHAAIPMHTLAAYLYCDYVLEDLALEQRLILVEEANLLPAIDIVRLKAAYEHIPAELEEWREVESYVGLPQARIGHFINKKGIEIEVHKLWIAYQPR